MDDRVLVWAPARDGRFTCGFLTEIGFSCINCEAWEDFRTELNRGVGAVVLAGEFLSASVLANLQAIMEAQPPWSDLPVIVVASTDGLVASADPFGMLGNVSVLQRPVSLDTLRSSVGAALRARRRQYQVRDLLQQRDEADTRKDEFLAMLAHELRNPLAPLRTALELLKLEPSPQVVGRAKATMERQVANLTRLVDDLLDVSRVTRGKIALKRTVIDARQRVSDAVSAAQPSASRKNLRLELQLPDQPVIVDADPVRLEQMLGNLIGNAMKFTLPGGHIRVSLETECEWAVMRVRDSGVGIPTDHLDKVFELFGQASASLDRSQGGLGIGLTVVRLIAELHGGRARVFSDGIGQGTEAVVHLPLRAAPALPEGSPPSDVPRATSTKRVLVIDDNVDVAEMLAAYLRQIGYEVIQAHDGPSGLDAALQHQPEVIVCDLGLPGLDGYEIARTVRQVPRLRSSLLVAVSGYGESADREKSRIAGFSHHLTKPADPMELADLIANGHHRSEPRRPDESGS
jgi:signal transduction histidine kinase/ActR/RegA family two-component response regulator